MPCSACLMVTPPRVVGAVAHGGHVWRQTTADEAASFLPTLGASTPCASGLLNASNFLSTALRAVQDGFQFQLKSAYGAGTKQDVANVDDADAHVLRYGGRLLGGSDNYDNDADRTKRAVAAQESLVRQATVLDGCCDGGQYLPIFYILKDELHLNPVDISLAMGFSSLPFMLKPALAMASDRMPIFGRKRTPYLAGSMLLVAGTYAGASLAQSYASVLAGRESMMPWT
ncbi:unnamed protein product [Effrenium voratum]|uniref:Uncharacterized protein n=1 Tax=Effrenium voratum TaxID=2562239 RepID=A0AA36MSD7_9DINO|nr:unnamed protein product [Effrenium voratum]